VGDAVDALGPSELRGRRLSALDTLVAEERSAVLADLLAAHPDLVAEAEQAAFGLLTSAAVDEVAADVSLALLSIPLGALGARAGRVRGRGYVHETDAAWELVEETIGPFLVDLRRRARLDLLDAAAGVAVGIVAGIYEVRDGDEGSVVAYAGPDALRELADEVLAEAARLGVAIPEDAPGRYWPRWSDLG
jgi:hypothetical protein